MSSSPPTEAPAAAFVCDSGDAARSACKLLPFFKEKEGKRYCVLHYPGKEKCAAFEEARKRKLDAEDFNFCGAWFPDAAEFDAITFTKNANFNYTTFSAEAHFRYAEFKGEALFSHATFVEDANFYCSKFGAVTGFGTDFKFATFKGEANFRYATFVEVANFRQATFKEEVRFSGNVRFPGDEERRVFGDKSSLELEFARIEKPDLLSFHTVTLRPHWFVNVDARKFEFINVNWNWRNISTKKEIKSLRRKKGLSAHGLLAIACRNLAVNAEENHRYEEASRFRYMAMEARRLERWRGFAFWTLGWWYWLASGYGERVWRAFVVLIGVWLVAAALYTRVGFARWEPRVATEKEAAEARRDEVGESLRWPRALTYSLGVMTLQKPEPRPATNAAQSLVMIETILGPVQAALLALAIRRKFMR